MNKSIILSILLASVSAWSQINSDAISTDHASGLLYRGSNYQGRTYVTGVYEAVVIDPGNRVESYRATDMANTVQLMKVHVTTLLGATATCEQKLSAYMDLLNWEQRSPGILTHEVKILANFTNSKAKKEYEELGELFKKLTNQDKLYDNGLSDSSAASKASAAMNILLTNSSIPSCETKLINARQLMLVELMKPGYLQGTAGSPAPADVRAKFDELKSKYKYSYSDRQGGSPYPLARKFAPRAKEGEAKGAAPE